MNKLTKSLLVGLLEQENYITGFYGGGFKPPTKGHFAVVKKSLEEFPDIDKFYIVIGSGIRDGVSQDESYSVWSIYKKYLGDKVEIVKADSSPLKYVKDYIKTNTDHKSLIFIGSRDGNDKDEQDFVKRKDFFDNYGSHVEVKKIKTSGGTSGTKAREAAKISKEQFFQYLPKELTDEERNLIFEYVQTVIQENALKKVADKAKELGKNFAKAFKNQKDDFKGFRPLVVKYLKKQDLTPEEEEKLKQNFTDILKTSGVAITFPVLGASGSVLLGWLTNKLTKGKFTTLPSKFKDELLETQLLEIISGVNLSQPLNENESFYLDIPKFNQPKTTQQYLIENINEINLSKENAVDVNGDLTGGTFKVGDIVYEYSIKNIPNPYKDLGLFYNIQFTPKGEVTSIPKGGKENYIKILSTMYKIIVDFIEKEKPEYLGISSLDTNRDKNYHTVYNRLTDNPSNLIPGYFRKDSNLKFNSPQGEGRFIVLKRKKNLNENASYSQNIDVMEKIAQLTNHMIDKGMNIEPLPSMEFIDGDSENAKDFFGKTAYYDPNRQHIVLYTEGRHPKDIVRSYAHEMIHHIQNLEGRLENINTTNTHEDDHLNDIEAEANLKGTMTFRNWIDGLEDGISPFSKKNEEYILSDIKEYGDILEFKIDLEDTYQYSFNSNVGEFYDDINNVKTIVKLQPTTKDIPEFKFYSLQNGKQLSFSRLKHHNPRVMNTIFKIFMDEVLPKNPKILIQPFDYLRYRLFRAMLNNNLDGNQYKIDTKDDPMGQSILLVQKLNQKLNEYDNSTPSSPQEKFSQETGKDWAKESLSIVKHKGYDLENYEIKTLPLNSIKPTQFGEDYINPSSEYEAEQYQKYIDGEIEVEDLRREDFYPIVVDKDTMEILDGNHRHAVHTILGIPKIKAILISKNWTDILNENPTTIESLLEEEDQLMAEVVNPDGEGFEYEESNVKGLYTYKDSRDNLYFSRVFYQNTSNPYFEFKAGWFEDNDISKPKYEPQLPPNTTGMDNLKRRNTVAKIYRDEIIPYFKEKSPLSNQLIINPISDLRYTFSKRLVQNYTPKTFEIQYDDKDKKFIKILSKKMEEEKSKDPFGLNQCARELAQGLEEGVINEGRYDTLANKLSSTAFKVFKDIHDRGDKVGTFEFRVDHPEEEHDIPSKDFFFDFEGEVEITDGEYKVDGGANAGYDDEGEPITPLLSVKFKIPKNPKWSTISMDLKDVVRHELEHLTQDGDNERSGKYMEDDQLIRDLIDADLLPKSQYFKLEKEIDAMMQGLYFKAKKSRRPFKDVIDDYLNTQPITKEEKEKILDLWRERRKALSLPLFENEEKVMKYKIFLDMDGVLVDFDQQFKDITGMYPKEFELNHTIGEFWKAIDKSGVGFWRGMKWMPGGESLYKRASQHDHALLSSPSRSEVSKIGKRLWRRDKTPNTKLILSLSHLKKNYAAPNHILIDDRESNIQQWRDAGGIGILYKSADQVNKELDKLGL